MSEEAKLEFLHDVDRKKEWIYERLRWLRDDKGLDAEQLLWYYNKYDKYIDKELIKQEYPCTPEEAFLMSGKPVFDIAAILSRLTRVPKPIKTGYFAYDYDGLKITNIRWVNDRNGYIKIYKTPGQLAASKVCIGGDTAGEGSDWYVGMALDAKTGEQVAVLRHKHGAHQYARQMYCLGKYYKDALIGIEANFDTFPIEELQRLCYPLQYVREKVDEYTGKTEKRFGFRTTKLSRPPILAHLIEIVQDHCETINDRETLEELLRIVKNEEGRIEAPKGLHDDMMMALAIAHKIRDQVVFPVDPMEMQPQYHFNTEKKSAVQYDYGEDRVII